MNRIEITTIKERVDLVRVINHYLMLEKKGNAWLGLCPFHDDHHPSLRVDAQKGLYHCFSCGASGDAFRFVQEKEGCGFVEAVGRCLDICHLPMLVPEARTPQPRAEKQKAGAGSTLPSASASPAPKAVPSVADNERYAQALLPYDPGMEELREVYASFGVGVAPPVVPKGWDFTRGRIVFPIRNGQGELVAFAARYRGDLPAKKIPKYLNSDTSAIYKKSELLYGWFRAVEKVRETGLVFLTEGYKDTLAMHAAGFTNTVALCGVNLSDHHLALLRAEASTVCLFLDADEVGRKTAEGVIPKLREAGLQVVDMLPEGGKDADELFRRMGREAFAGWVGGRMLPPIVRRSESLLVSACHRWPDTCCLTDEGNEVLYVDHIRRILSSDGLLPAEGLVPAPDTSLQASSPISGELDHLYALHTEPSHSERVRHSELIRYLFLNYLEVRLSERVRLQARRLSDSGMNKEQRTELLSSLQYHRNYLSLVSRELGRG